VTLDPTEATWEPTEAIWEPTEAPFGASDPCADMDSIPGYGHTCPTAVEILANNGLTCDSPAAEQMFMNILLACPVSCGYCSSAIEPPATEEPTLTMEPTEQLVTLDPTEATWEPTEAIWEPTEAPFGASDPCADMDSIPGYGHTCPTAVEILANNGLTCDSPAAEQMFMNILLACPVSCGVCSPSESPTTMYTPPQPAATEEPTEAAEEDICETDCKDAYIASGGCADCLYSSDVTSAVCQMADFSPWPACSHCVVHEANICSHSWMAEQGDDEEDSKEVQFELITYGSGNMLYTEEDGNLNIAYECFEDSVLAEPSVSWPNWPLEEGKQMGDCQNSYNLQFLDWIPPYEEVYCITPGLIGIIRYNDAECTDGASSNGAVRELRFDECDQDDYVGANESSGYFRLKWTGYCEPKYVEVIAPPSESPTAGPSASPTVVPSENPSTSPTVVPTVNPTTGPSKNPTVEPSLTPSAIPSVSPSAVPTFAPSTTPSVQPSTNPSMAPSRTSQHREVAFLNDFATMVGSETEEFLASCTQKLHSQFVESTTSCVNTWSLAFDKMIVRIHDHCGDECASLDSDAEYLEKYGLEVPGFGHLYTEFTGTPNPTFAPTEATLEPTAQPTAVTAEPTTLEPTAQPTAVTAEPTTYAPTAAATSAEPTAAEADDLADLIGDEDLEESSASGLFSVFSMSLIVLALL